MTRSYKKISNEERRKIKNKVDSGISTKAISDALELNYWSVLKIVNNYQKTGSIDVKPKGGDTRSKLTPEMKTQIRTWVDENSTIKLQALCDKVLSTFDVDVSTSTIDRCINEFHYTLKQVSIVPVLRNNERIIQQRLEYSSMFREYEITHSSESLIFLDEVGFTVSTRPKRGRSLRGTSTFVDVPAARTRNISVLAAMNRNGMIYHKVHDKALNGEDFKSALIDLKNTCDERSIVNCVFIMDNARIHHYSRLNETINDYGIVVEYLPAYSPFLNPIENCFSKWKNYVLRGKANNEEELKTLIENGFESINSNDCDGYFRKMLRFIVKSEKREEIFE